MSVYLHRSAIGCLCVRMCCTYTANGQQQAHQHTHTLTYSERPNRPNRPSLVLFSSVAAAHVLFSRFPPLLLRLCTTTAQPMRSVCMYAHVCECALTHIAHRATAPRVVCWLCRDRDSADDTHTHTGSVFCMLALLRDDDCVCLRCVCVVCARYVCVRRVRTDLAVRLAVPQLLVVRPSSVKHIVRAQRCASPFSRFSRSRFTFFSVCTYPRSVFVRVHTHTHIRASAPHTRAPQTGHG